MKLLHVAESYAVSGGAERHLVRFCDAWEAAGHQSVVVYGRHTGREPAAPPRAVHRIDGLTAAGRLDAGVSAALAAIVARERPDAVMTHQAFDPAVARVLGRRPSLFFSHDFKLICPGGRRTWRGGRTCTRPMGLECLGHAYIERCMPRDPRVGLPLIRRRRAAADLVRAGSDVLVASEFMRGMVRLNGFADERIHVVPYFVDLPGRDGVPEPGRILAPGRLVVEKGLDDLVRALREVPAPAHLVLAGAGPARAALERIARDTGVIDRVRFTGWLDDAALDDAYGAAEIVVVPSTWPEPFGIVGIEAMAHARPVVAADVGGVRQWLRPGATGVLVPPRDPGALGRALRRLREDPALRARLGAEGRRVAGRDFSAGAHLAKVVDIVEAARATSSARGA